MFWAQELYVELLVAFYEIAFPLMPNILQVNWKYYIKALHRVENKGLRMEEWEE